MKKKYLLLFCLSFLCSHKIWADVGSIQIRLNENMQVVDLATSSVSTPTIDEVFVQQGGLTTAEENQCTVNADGTVQEAECTCPDGGTLTPHGNQYVCCKDKKIYDGKDYSSYFMPTCGCPEGYRLPWDNVSKENLCCKNGQNCYTVLGGIEICDDSDACGCPDGSKGYENVCCDDEGKVLTAMETSTQNYTLCGCAIADTDLRKLHCDADKCTKTQGMEWCEAGVCMPKDTCPCVPGSTTSPCTEKTACTTQNGCWYDGTCYQKQASCGEGGRSWNDNVCSCTCPENEHWNDTTNQCEECVQTADCSGGKVCESNTCVCPEGEHWNGTTCEACPEDKPKWNDTECEACQADTFWDGNDCVTCADVDEATPYWNGEACVQCTEKDNCEGNQICKTDYTCGCEDENKHGTACQECYGDFGAESEWSCSEDTPVCDKVYHTCVTCAAANENTPVWKVIEEKGQCVTCAVADQKKPVWSGTECEACPEDTPKWNSTSEACEACPTNSEWSGDQCQCKAGYTLKDDGTCTPCDKGTYKISAGNEGCIFCGDNQTTAGTGATTSEECEACPTNRPIWNSFSCVTCADVDEVTPVWNGTTCEVCPEATPKWNGSECVTCAVNNSDTPVWNGTTCEACPEGEHWNGTTCEACPENTPAWNGFECVTCAANNSATPFWNGTACVECLENEDCKKGLCAGNKCVACTKGGDCPGEWCDLENGLCVAGCNTTMVPNEGDKTCQCDKTKDPEDPSKDSKTPVWDAWRNRCVSCFRYNEKTPVWNGTTCEACPAETPVWDLYNEKCVKCYDSISSNWTDLGCGSTVDHSSYNPRQNKRSSGEVIDKRVCKVDADNTNNNTCVQCTEHSHCPGAAPKCENNSCSECPSEEPFWDGNACVTCADNNSDTPVWDATRKTCVTCAAANENTPVWNDTKKECVSCAVADSTRPVWNATSKTCVPCVSVYQNKPAWDGSACATCAAADPTNPVWNATNKTCEPCPTNTPIWKNGECIACPTNTSKWDTNKQQCVQCTLHDHCGPGKHCHNGSCANCAVRTQCGCTDMAQGDGTCIEKGEVAPTSICPPKSHDRKWREYGCTTPGKLCGNSNSLEHTTNCDANNTVKTGDYSGENRDP